MSTYHAPVREWHGLPPARTTSLGRWAVILAVVSGVGWLVALPALVVDPTADVFVPWGILLLVGLIPGFLCGIAASIVAFLAMVRPSPKRSAGSVQTTRSHRQGAFPNAGAGEAQADVLTPAGEVAQLGRDHQGARLGSE